MIRTACTDVQDLMFDIGYCDIEVLKEMCFEGDNQYLNISSPLFIPFSGSDHFNEISKTFMPHAKVIRVLLLYFCPNHYKQ